ncbi:MAG TPA: beta-ketoacyl-[acyl-carrier-protein] synthase family protein [Clostridia bacterium]
MIHTAVITGIGAITNIGLNTKETWNGMKAGKCGISEIDVFDTTNLPIKIAGQIRGFDITDYDFSSDYAKYDRSTQLGLAAAKLAIDDSGILPFLKNSRTGVYVGNAGGALSVGEAMFDQVVKNTPLQDNIYYGYFRILASRVISECYKLTGPSQVISTGCTSGLDAIGMTMRAIERGEIDIAICGGTEAPITPATICSFAKIGALSTIADPNEASRPYDKDRDGFVLAEGTGMLILESMEHARKRGAKIYGAVAGFATNCSAFHMTGMPEDGGPIAEVITKSLEVSNIKPDEIDYINSHGSSTPMNDFAETQAYKLAFGDKAKSIPISSIKSMIGHSLGSIGAIEVVTCALVLEDQIIPPTINFNVPGDGCDLDYVPNTARSARVNNIVSNGSGFSGLNSSIVMTKVFGG